MQRWIFGAAMLAVLPLAGCDSLGFGDTPVAAPAARPLDYRHDDVAAAIFVIDLPASLQPIPRLTAARFDIVTADRGNRPFRASLIRADGDGIDASLPPPAAGRTYYLLGFADADRRTVAANQQWLATLPPAAAPVVQFEVLPKFCETAAIDPAATNFSVLVALPGAGPFTPLVNAQKLTTVLNGGQLPLCGNM